jgi:hypothetical protein
MRKIPVPVRIAGRPGSGGWPGRSPGCTGMMILFIGARTSRYAWTGRIAR